MLDGIDVNVVVYGIIGIGAIVAALLGVLSKIGLVSFGRKNCPNNKCPDRECQKSVIETATNVKGLVGTVSEQDDKIDHISGCCSFMKGKLEGVKIILKEEA